MQVNMRREPRRIGRLTYTLCWQLEDERMHSAEACGIDLSRSGIRVNSSMSVPPKSLTPARSIWAAPTAPILTQETWMFSMAP